MLLLHKGGLLDICFSAQLPAFKHWIQFVWTERARRGRLPLPRHAPREHPTRAWATHRTPPWSLRTPLQDFFSGKRDNHYDLRAGLNNKHLGKQSNIIRSDRTETHINRIRCEFMDACCFFRSYEHLSSTGANRPSFVSLFKQILPVERMNTPNLFWTSWRNSRRLFMCRQTDGTCQLFGGKPSLWSI